MPESLCQNDVLTLKGECKLACNKRYVSISYIGHYVEAGGQKAEEINLKPIAIVWIAVDRRDLLLCRSSEIVFVLSTAKKQFYGVSTAQSGAMNIFKGPISTDYPTTCT